MKLAEFSKISDESLVSAIRKGDHFAFDQLFRKYAPNLYSFVLSIIKNEAEAEEVVQDIFLKVWEKRARLDPSLSFRSYLFTIALNTSKNIFRKRLLEESHRQRLALELDFDETREVSEAEFRELLGYVDTLIDTLPSSRREIFILSKKQGLKNSEIAERLGISEQTVKNQLVTALKYLRSMAAKDNKGLAIIFLMFLIHF